MRVEERGLGFIKANDLLFVKNDTLECGGFPTKRPVSAFHNRTISGSPRIVTSHFPLGLTKAEFQATDEEWAVACPVAGSHNLRSVSPIATVATLAPPANHLAATA